MAWKNGADIERDAQDVAEKHVYKTLTFGETGAYVTVSGNDTSDTDVPVLVAGGQIHNMNDDTEAEVFVIGNGSDSNLKMALVTGPRDKQYKSNKGESWGQDPIDPEARHGYTPNGLRLHAKDKTIAEYLTGMIEIDVKNNKIYFRCPVIFQIQPTTGPTPPYKK